MAKKDEKTFLEQALEYHARGWCIIPIPYGKKKARIRWKQYQDKCTHEVQLRKWFSKACNIAVVLGEVSEGLSCRDFDRMESYKQWSEQHPQLAKTLPTVQTSKGMHVYFEGHVEGTKHYDDGELRGKGGYCLLPPSVHPDGISYQWANPVLNGNLLAVDAELAGFIPNVTEQAEQTQQTHAIVWEGSVEEAIRLTLPKRVGTRNRRVFLFARYLKSMPQYFDADPKKLRLFVEQWYKEALPNIRTKEFEETWIDFLKGWQNVKYKIGDEPMTKMFERAVQTEPPKIAVEKYPEHEKLKLFVSLCRELQRSAGEGSFYLSCRTAGRLLDVAPITTSRWFFLLESDDILELVEKGGTTKENVRLASRFKYLGD